MAPVVKKHKVGIGICGLLLSMVVFQPPAVASSSQAFSVDCIKRPGYFKATASNVPRGTVDVAWSILQQDGSVWAYHDYKSPWVLELTAYADRSVRVLSGAAFPSLVEDLDGAICTSKAR